MNRIDSSEVNSRVVSTMRSRRMNRFPHEPNLNERTKKTNKGNECMNEYFLGSFPPRRSRRTRRDVRRRRRRLGCVRRIAIRGIHC